MTERAGLSERWVRFLSRHRSPAGDRLVGWLVAAPDVVIILAALNIQSLWLAIVMLVLGLAGTFTLRGMIALVLRREARLLDTLQDR